jgi:hypothetical protein
VSSRKPASSTVTRSDGVHARGVERPRGPRPSRDARR